MNSGNSTVLRGLGDRSLNVLLLAGSGPLNLKVVYCLARLGARIHVVATSASNIIRRSRHLHSFVVHEGVSDASAPEGTVQWMRRYCGDSGISVIVPGDIGTSGFLAAAREKLPDTPTYPCSDAALLDRIHDKWHFASALMEAGIPTPRTALVESVSDLDTVQSEIGFPVMVKPLSCESSHGVLRMGSAAELSEHVRSGRAYSTPPLIAQRFVEGRDIDISVLADRGKVVLAVTQQLQPDGSLRFFHDAATRQLADAVVARYAYHGIAHFDMRIADDTGELFVLECNPRFWYSMPASMWQGVNFLEAGIRLSLGQSIEGEHALIPGSYFLPGSLLNALRRPWQLRRLTLRNLRGVMQPALDPFPHLADLYRKRLT